MRRNTGLVLGLPIPDQPIDINAPRASRNKQPNEDVSGLEGSIQTPGNAPPSTMSKTASSAVQEDALAKTDPVEATGSVQPLDAIPPEVPAKRQRGKKKKGKTAPEEPAMLPGSTVAGPTELPPAPEAPPKKKKGKKAAPTLDGDIEMNVPGPETTTDSQTITVGDSIVPPSPGKKKSRKRKGLSTATVGADAATPLDPNASAVPSTSEVPTSSKDKRRRYDEVQGNPRASDETRQVQDTSKPVPHGGKSSGRTKTPSTLAQQVLRQENNKVLEREAKALRKKEKAQKAIIRESPEDTAAFLATTHALASGSAPTTDNNIEIYSVKAPATTGGLQRVRQSEANKLIAQRATQRLFSSAPPSSAASASGSEALGPTSNSRGRSSSRASSRAVPPSVSSSRAVSVAPSNYSVPASGAYSDFSGAVSSQPSTRPASPRSEMASHSAGHVVSSGPTLAECYAGVPEEFAPRLPEFEPLPPPLREPERLKPVPYVDVSQLSAPERKAYAKSYKLGVKDLTANDHIIVSSVISRLEALINTIDCFPNDEDAWHLMQVANAWACRKHNLGNLRLVKGSPYEEMLAGRLSQTKSGIVEFAMAAVPEAYIIKTQEVTQPVIDYNKATVKYWLDEGNFTCPPTDFGALYERSTIEDILKKTFFQKYVSTGVVHRDLFGTVTIPLIAGVAAALEKGLLEYETGVRVKQAFSSNHFRPKWSSHVVSLCDMFKSPQGHRLVKHLRDLGAKLLAPFPAMSSSMTTVVAPRIPSITRRYGQAVTAPPPPAPPGFGAEYWSNALPSTSVASPVPDQPGDLKQKVRPKVRTAGTKTTPAPEPVPQAPPPPPEAPIDPNSKTESGTESETGSETESETESETDSDSVEIPLADVADPAAWARSVQVQSTSAAQFDALHGLVGGESSEGEGAAGVKAVATAGDNNDSDTKDSDESMGEGNSGAGGLTVRSKEDTEMHGPENKSSGTETESGNES